MDVKIDHHCDNGGSITETSVSIPQWTRNNSEVAARWQKFWACIVLVKTLFSLSISTQWVAFWYSDVSTTLYFVKQLQNTNNACTRPNTHSLRLQPKRNSFTTPSQQGGTGLPVRMRCRFAAFPFPPACVFVTVNGPGSRFASNVHGATSPKQPSSRMNFFM